MTQPIGKSLLGFGLAALVLAAASVPMAGAESAAVANAAAPRLTGTAAWAKLLGNSITGTTPDGPYTEFFQTDGTVQHLDRDGQNRGRWRLNDLDVCLVFPEDDEDCRRLEVDPDGPQGAFVDSDGTPYRFEILPGNAKRL